MLDKDAQINHLQTTVDGLKVEKQEQAHKIEELTTLQQQQLEVQQREIRQLSGQLRSLELQLQEERSQGSKQGAVSMASQKVRQ